MRSESRVRRFTGAAAAGLALLFLAGCPKDNPKEFGALIESLRSEDAGERWQAILRAKRLKEPAPEVIEQLKAIFRGDREAMIRAQALLALEKHKAVDDPILQVVAQNAMTRQDYLGLACFDLLKSRGPDLLEKIEQYAATRETEAERKPIRALIARLRDEMDN